MSESKYLDFCFTQSNLQTFTFCRKRFHLRYIKNLVWPAALIADNQHLLDRDAGTRFHQLLHQYFLGFDLANLRNVANADSDPRMAGWFENFLSSRVCHLEGNLTAETLYTSTVAGYRLSAKVDLLQVEQNSVKIYDWKTSRQLPNAAMLRKHAQSMVYPLVISQVIKNRDAHRNLEKLTLVYWEANFPDQSIEISSRSEDWQNYQRQINSLIDAITSLDEDDFVMTSETRKCGWCEYYSYCHRRKMDLEIEEMAEMEQPQDENNIPEDTFFSPGMD